MKILQFFLALATSFFAITQDAFSQNLQPTSHYVVIGAFAKLNNAVQFTDLASHDNFQAQYAININRNLYYVFIFNTSEKSKAFTFALKITDETKYKDAWVFSGSLGSETGIASNPIEEESLAEVSLTEDKVVEPTLEKLPDRDSVMIQPVIIVDSSSIKTSVEEVTKSAPDGKPFYFKLINAESGKEVLGEVQVVESKATLYRGFKGNELIYLVPPRNGTGIYQITIQAPGYKPAKLAFNYEDPSAVSSGVGEKQETIFTFDLVQVKKGDYIDFSNVRFFHNSSILEPVSQPELNELVTLLMDNPRYKIEIHGHCNGNESREIIALGSSSDFFALDASKNKKETATPKMLTEYRAETVRNFLVSQGIDRTRVTIRGEGGKMMIYPSASTLANYNDRVEIEVLKTRR